MTKPADITGEKFGRLTALRPIPNGDFAPIRWLFSCECGVEKPIRFSNVRRGLTVSCGCLNKEVLKQKLKDITGQKFGCLEAIKFVKRTSNLRTIWLFRCNCGVEKEIEAYKVASGKSKSCGCWVSSINNPRFKNGKRQKNGYVYTYVRVGKKKFSVAEHRTVMENIIGRKLLRNETIHHRNSIRHDNRPENLELWASHQPSGARVEDLVQFAKEILQLYGHLY